MLLCRLLFSSSALVLTVLFTTAFFGQFAYGACPPGLVLPKNPFVAQSWEDLQRRRHEIFPRAYQVNKADPYFRQALIEVHGQLDFYTRMKIPLSEIHIDHIWPQAKGGPDNIFNFVLSSDRENRRKSAHAHLRSVTFWLALNSNHYAHRVAKRYFELRKSAEANKIDPSLEQKINRQIDSSKLSYEAKMILKQVFEKKLSRQDFEPMSILKSTIKTLEALKHNRKLRIDKSYFSKLVDALIAYSQWELSFNRQISESRMVEALIWLANSDESAASLFKVLRDFSSENFSQFQQSHRFLMALSDLVAQAYFKEQSFAVRMRVWVSGQQNKVPVNDLRSLIAIFLVENSLRPKNDKLDSNDYLSGIELLVSAGLSLSEIKTLSKYLINAQHDAELSFEALADSAVEAYQNCVNESQKISCVKRKLSRIL